MHKINKLILADELTPTQKTIARIAGLVITRTAEGGYFWECATGSDLCTAEAECYDEFFEHIEELAELAARKVIS